MVFFAPWQIITSIFNLNRVISCHHHVMLGMLDLFSFMQFCEANVLPKQKISFFHCANIKEWFISQRPRHQGLICHGGLQDQDQHRPQLSDCRTRSKFAKLWNQIASCQTKLGFNPQVSRRRRHIAPLATTPLVFYKFAWLNKNTLTKLAGQPKAFHYSWCWRFGQLASSQCSYAAGESQVWRRKVKIKWAGEQETHDIGQTSPNTCFLKDRSFRWMPKALIVSKYFTDYSKA